MKRTIFVLRRKLRNRLMLGYYRLTFGNISKKVPKLRFRRGFRKSEFRILFDMELKLSFF